MSTEPFDHHSPEHAADPVAAYRELRERGGVATTDRHGGYTVLARYDHVTEVARLHETYSSMLELPGGEGFGGGITLPHNPAARRMSLSEMDPPDWRPIRKMLNPLFTPEAVSRFEPRIREITNECLDRVIEKGSCDFVFDLCNPVPGIVTLEYLGLDTSEWERYAVPVHMSTYTPRDVNDPRFQKLMAGFEWIFQQIRDEIARRRATPSERDDMLSALMNVDDPDGLMTDDLVFETAYTGLAAGVDTTTSLLSAALWHLDKYPEDRARLVDDPSLLPDACEEFLRMYCPGQAMSRTVKCPVKVGDHEFARGDRVLLAWASANRDEQVFERPDEFVIDRSPNRHLAFGFGIHRCIGAALARQEFIVVMDEVLRRMPDYAIDHSATHRYPDVGLMYGFQGMPATFTPGLPVLAARSG
jgi:cytochrome P450